MRYIKKNETPQYISNWVALRNKAEQSIGYDDFDAKSRLNDDLRQEQHHICCYCQQKLTHYQAVKIGGSHNEHLIPQKGEVGDALLQMEYGNLYACCISSRGLEKKKQYCGEFKGDKRIRGVIQEENCNDLFKYNTLGEILPAGNHFTYQEYIQNIEGLSQVQREVLDVIRTLNLNCTYLVEERKKEQTALFSVVMKKEKPDVESWIVENESNTHYLRFFDMLLYFVHNHLKRIDVGNN